MPHCSTAAGWASLCPQCRSFEQGLLFASLSGALAPSPASPPSLGTPWPCPPAAVLPRSCAGAVSAALAASHLLPLSPGWAWGSVPMDGGTSMLGPPGWACAASSSPLPSPPLFSSPPLRSDSAGARPQAWALLPSQGRALHGARQVMGLGTPRAQLMPCLSPAVPRSLPPPHSCSANPPAMLRLRPALRG